MLAVTICTASQAIEQADGDMQRAAAKAGRLEQGGHTKQDQHRAGRPEHPQHGDDGQQHKVDPAPRLGRRHQPLARNAREEIADAGRNDDPAELPERARRKRIRKEFPAPDGDKLQHLLHRRKGGRERNGNLLDQAELTG
jgi:hypothetical protein